MASANVESVFSGTGRISARSQTMDPLLLSHGARNSDAESDDSSGGEEEREEEEGEEEEGGEEQV